MQLIEGSFSGLGTTGLYLHDCSLQRVSHNVLLPLSSTLKYLWLNGNDILTLDVTLEPLFSALQHLRLGENPLLCDCSAIWLKRLYDNKHAMFHGAPAPSCRGPERLRGRAFNETSVEEFQCRAPQLTRVEVTANDTSGRLSCAAAGQPAPTIYWIQPSGRATRFTHSNPTELQQHLDLANDDGPQLENEGTLMIETLNSESRLLGMYICVANNDAGNVTLTISVPAASDLPRAVTYITTTPSSATLLVNSTRQTVSMSSTVRSAVARTERNASTSRHRSRQTFTLSELVVAVVVTHTVTLLFYVVLSTLCYWRTCAADKIIVRRRKHSAMSSKRVHHRSTVCSAGSRSTLYTAPTATKLPSLPQSPSSPHHAAAVFLDELSTQRDFFFDTATSAAAYRFRNGETYG